MWREVSAGWALGDQWLLLDGDKVWTRQGPGQDVHRLNAEALEISYFCSSKATKETLPWEVW